MSVDMFISLNNDILQCILYEWLDILAITELDIAVCNHSIRPLYYEALQSSTSTLLSDNFGEISERFLYEFLQWSKRRKINNPIQKINLIIEEDYPSSVYVELSKDFKSMNYVKALILNYWNPLLIYALASLRSLTSLQIDGLKLTFLDHSLLGIFLKQLTMLEKISIINCSFDAILISFLSEIPSLKYFIVFNDNSTCFNWLDELSNLTQLEALEFNDCQIDQLLDLSFLTSFTHLRILILRFFGIYLQDILSLTQLKMLEIGHLIIMEANINYKNYLPLQQLQSITVYDTNIDHNFIQFILQSKQLKDFIFSHRSHFESSLFYDIASLSNLKHLALINVDIDEQLFDNICQLSQLELLDLSCDSNQINKQNICLPFSQLNKQLSYLAFCYQPYIINKNTLEEISQLQNLTYLSFDWNSNSLEELQPLSQLKQLSELKIQNETEPGEPFTEKQNFQIKEILQLPKLKV